MNKTATAARDLGGIASLVAMVVIWGSSFMLITLSLDAFTPSQLVSVRLILGGLFLLLLVAMQRGNLSGILEHWRWLLLVSVLNYALPFYTVVWAQQTVPSSIAAIFMSAIPLFTLLLTRTILGQAVTPRRWIGFLIGLGGLLWLAGDSALSGIGASGMLAGQLALLGAAMFFALGSIIIRRMPAMPAMPATAVLLILGGILLLPFGGYEALGRTIEVLSSSNTTLHIGLAALVFLALIPTGFGQFMRTYTIQQYGPVFYSLVGYFIPIWATVLGVMVLNEPITLEILMAFAVILVGLLLAHDGGFAVSKSG